MTNTQKASGETRQANSGKGAHDQMLQDFFADGIKEIYYAEKYIVIAFPKLINAATSAELKQAFQEHLDVTQNQLSRLEKVFQLLGNRPQPKKCDAIEGIIKELESGIENTAEGTATRDIALILSVQKVEHYEIAAYGGLAQLGCTLGLEEIAELLTTTLEEEKEADSMLSGIAESDINYNVMEGNESSIV